MPDRAPAGWYPPRALALAALLAVAAAPIAAAPVVPRQAGGDLGGTVVVGDRLYAGQGPAIVTWLLSPDGSAPPVRLHTTSPLPGLVHGLAVRGPWLYAAWEIPYPTGKIGIFSLADPDHPAHVADYAYSTEPFLRPGGLAVVGDQLLLGDPETGVYSFSLVDPTSPTLSAHLPLIGIDRLAVTGTVLVSWGRNFIGMLGVQLFDVSDPAAPSPLGSYSAGNYLDAAVAGDRMVLAGDGLEVVDLSDPKVPTWLATVPGFSARTVALVPGHFLFGDADGVHSWSLADPSAPVEVDVLAAPADRTARIALHPAAGGTAVLFADTARGLAVDVSVPGDLGLDHLFDLPGAIDATGVVESGGLVWVSDFYTGLKVLDASLATVGRADPPVGLGAFEDVAVEGTFAHLANWGSGLVVVDVATPAAPFVRAQLPFEFATAVDAEGSFVHLASSTNDSLYGVVDVADPDQPELRGTLPVLHTWDLLLHDGYVLVADDFAGLPVVDASDPDAPEQIGLYSGCELAVGIAARGDLAAVACSDGTLHLVDLSDPTQPAPHGLYDLGGIHAGLSVALDRGLAWFGHTGGVELVDVSTPAAPYRLRSVPLASDARALALSSTGSVWVAGGLGGVYEVAVVVFRDGVESGETGAWSATVP